MSQTYSTSIATLIATEGTRSDTHLSRLKIDNVVHDFVNQEHLCVNRGSKVVYNKKASVLSSSYRA